METPDTDAQRDAPATPLVVLTLEAESRPIPLPMVTFSIPATQAKPESEKPKKAVNRQERKVCPAAGSLASEAAQVQTGNPGSKRHTRYVNGSVVVMLLHSLVFL